MGKNRNLVLGVLLGLFGGFMSCYFITGQLNKSSPALAFVDMDKVTKGVSSHVLKQSLNIADTEKEIERLREKFNELVANYSKKSNKLLYSFPKPLKGSLEITEELLNELFKTLTSLPQNHQLVFGNEFKEKVQAQTLNNKHTNTKREEK